MHASCKLSHHNYRSLLQNSPIKETIFCNASCKLNLPIESRAIFEIEKYTSDMPFKHNCQYIDTDGDDLFMYGYQNDMTTNLMYMST